ncbi:hypothetical protein [Streptomyces luteireticuli]|uniref:hypothetical protein n=1 Tax=Streptomyces luteireticuli TaxID=173858 RepID=UPI003556EB45
MNKQTPKKATVTPARPWPRFDDDVARAELCAMELLSRGMPERSVRLRTKLSARSVRRLAALLAEESKNPPRPRIVCRTPHRPLTNRHVTAAPSRAPRPEPVQAQLDLPAPEPVQMQLTIC